MLKLPYGTSNFSQIADEDYYFVDRTPYIAQLEQLAERYLFFLRPRRFGKTLFVSMLQCYYGLEYAARFTELFARFAIGQHPTPMANQYLVLHMEFSRINTKTSESTFIGSIFAALLYSTQIYTVHSEYETNRRYVDLLLTRRPPIAPNYQFAFELKFLKLADADQLEAKKDEALGQMQDYLQHDKLRALTDLRAWVVVFVGPKAQIILSVPTGK